MLIKSIIFTALTLLHFACSSAAQTVSIADAIWLEKPHFKIVTASATYLYDKAGGGFSSIIDREGKDWVQFNETGNDEYPESAAGRFRGLPNFVYRSDDSGAGHPGFDRCTSEKTAPNTITTQSKSGKWKWECTFYDNYATLTMLKVDPDHAYWLLYEGTPGGIFSPATSYWATDTHTPRHDAPDYYQEKELFEKWSWIYFGEKQTDRIFFIMMETPDDLEDTFGYLGSTDAGLQAPDGMTVFGFGRTTNTTPLMAKAPNRFFIGFMERAGDDQKAYRKIEKRLRKIRN